MVEAEPIRIGLLIAIAIVPAVAYKLFVRSRETHDREPLHAVWTLFFYGAAASMVGHGWFAWRSGEGLGTGELLLYLVLAAPLASEVLKVLGLPLARRHINEVEDGIVYATAIGVGYAVGANTLDIILDAPEGPLWMSAAAIVTTMLLHASTTALPGFGYSLGRMKGHPVLHVLPYLAVAVLVQAAYQFLLHGQDLFGEADARIIGLILGAGMVVLVKVLLHVKISHLETGVAE